jgi:opacity protein-like surface antigen
MLRNCKAMLVIVVGGLTSLSALSQESPSYKADVSFQGTGTFTKSTVQNGVTQDATNNGGILAGYRLFFKGNNGVEFSYGYGFDSTQNFGLAGGAEGVTFRTHEVSAAYVRRFVFRRWSPFVLAGASGLFFDPNNVTRASTQGRAGFLYGGGADFNINPRIFVRTEYRGFVYNSTTLNLLELNGTDRMTHNAEPSIGFGYRF